MSIQHTDLIGKRVKHNCGDPRCHMEGRVLNVVWQPCKSLGGEESEYWAIVQWEVNGVPYVQPVPLSKIKVIDETCS